MSSLLNRSSKLTQPNNTGTTFTNSSSVEQSVKSLNPNIAKDGSGTQKISMDSTDHQNSLHQTVNNDKLAHLVSPLDQYLSQLPKQPKHASKTSLLSNEEFDDLCKRLNSYCQRLKDDETNRGFIQGHQKKQDIFEAYKDYQHLNILSVTDNINDILTKHTDIQIIIDSLIETVVYYVNVDRENSSLELTASITNMLYINDEIQDQFMVTDADEGPPPSKLYQYLTQILNLMERFFLGDADNLYEEHNIEIMTTKSVVNPEVNKNTVKSIDKRRTHIVHELRELIKQIVHSIRSLVQLPSTAELNIDDVDLFIKWMPSIGINENALLKSKRKALAFAYSKILKTCYLLMSKLAEKETFDSHYTRSFDKDQSDLTSITVDKLLDDPLSNFGERLDSIDTFIYTLQHAQSDSVMLKLNPDVHYVGIRVTSGQFRKTDFVCRKLTPMHDNHQNTRSILTNFLCPYDQLLSHVYEIKVRKPVQTMYVMLGCETKFLSNRRVVEMKFRRDIDINNDSSILESVQAVSAGGYSTGEQYQNKHFCARIRLIKSTIQLMITCRPSTVNFQSISDSYYDNMNLKGITDVWNPEAEEYKMASTVQISNDPLWYPSVTILRIQDRLLNKLRSPMSVHSNLSVDGASLIQIDWKTKKKNFPASILTVLPNALSSEYIDDGVEPIQTKKTIPIKVPQFDPYHGLKATPVEPYGVPEFKLYSHSVSSKANITATATTVAEDAENSSKYLDTVVHMPILAVQLDQYETDPATRKNTLTGVNAETRKQTLLQQQPSEQRKKTKRSGKQYDYSDMSHIKHGALLFGRKKYYDSKAKTTGYWLNLTDTSKLRFNLNDEQITMAENGTNNDRNNQSLALTNSKRIYFEVDSPFSPLLLIRTQCVQKELNILNIDNTNLCNSILNISSYNILNVFIYQRLEVLRHSSGHYQQSLLMIICPDALLDDAYQIVKKQAPFYTHLLTDKLEIQVAELAELIVYLDGNIASALSDSENIVEDPYEIGMMPGPVATNLRRIFHVNVFHRFINQLTMDICPVNLFGQAFSAHEYHGSVHVYVRQPILSAYNQNMAESKIILPAAEKSTLYTVQQQQQMMIATKQESNMQELKRGQSFHTTDGQTNDGIIKSSDVKITAVSSDDIATEKIPADLRSSSSKTTAKTFTHKTNRGSPLHQTNKNHYGIGSDAKWVGRIRVSMAKKMFVHALENIHQNIKSRLMYSAGDSRYSQVSIQKDTSILPQCLDIERNILDEVARQMGNSCDSNKLARSLGIHNVIYEDLKQRFRKRTYPALAITGNSIKTIDTTAPKHVVSVPVTTLPVDEYGLRRLILYHWFAKTRLLNGRDSWNELCKALILCGYTDIAYIIGPKGAIEQNKIPEMLKILSSDEDIINYLFDSVKLGEVSV